MDVLALIANAIHRARIDFPQAAPGTTHDDQWVSSEDAALFAKAALAALDRAGLKVVPKE